MGILTHALKQECQIITTSKDVYGTLKEDSATTVPCKFRHIVGVQQVGLNREDIDADALLWLEPDVDVREGSIIKFENEYYRIERFVKARRLSETDVHFLKCELQKQDELVES